MHLARIVVNPHKITTFYNLVDNHVETCNVKLYKVVQSCIHIHGCVIKYLYIMISKNHLIIYLSPNSILHCDNSSLTGDPGDPNCCGQWVIAVHTLYYYHLILHKPHPLWSTLRPTVMVISQCSHILCACCVKSMHVHYVVCTYTHNALHYSPHDEDTVHHITHSIDCALTAVA